MTTAPKAKAEEPELSVRRLTTTLKSTPVTSTKSTAVATEVTLPTTTESSSKKMDDSIKEDLKT